MKKCEHLFICAWTSAIREWRKTGGTDFSFSSWIFWNTLNLDNKKFWFCHFCCSYNEFKLYNIYILILFCSLYLSNRVSDYYVICSTIRFPQMWFLLVSNQVWMLTGDKLETATCTAKNAHLITRNQDIHIFRQVSAWQGRSLKCICSNIAMRFLSGQLWQLL